MTHKLIYIILSILLASNLSEAQTLEAYYSFDNCNISDQTTNYSNGIETVGSINCSCGVQGDALSFTGNESIEFPDLDMSVEDDFTISFYMYPSLTGDYMDIISITDTNCNYDSTFNISYNPNLSKVKFEIKERGGRWLFLEGQIDPSVCWHHILVTNKGKQYDLYIDGERKESKEAVDRLVQKPDGLFKISGNPCNSLSPTPYIGLLDELKIFNYALSSEEINSLDLSPDKIISEDVTIFLGDQIQVNTGGTCAPSFNWNPNTDFDDPNSLNPIITPNESESYVFTVNHNNCQVRDTINIYVIDPAELDCEALLIPKAFTPNNDGLNETYGISNTFIVEQLNSFEIYDRWSNIVFSTSDLYEKWDGSFNNEQLNPGLFVYKISYSCNNESYEKVGSFSLIR